MIDRFQVGVITGTHGLKGEVKVFPTTDDPSRFRKLKKVILDLGREERILTVRSVRFFKQFVIVGFAESTRIEDVERLRGKSLLIDRADALPLEEGEFYIPDLIGLRVVDEDGAELGKLTDVLQTGANDVYAVETPEGKELLLPAIKSCILETNPQEGYMKVHLLPGLEDL
ncbi:MAG: ribosome maturation factor RimM [Eubacteriales bacterium]|nr:ribosome maturation factor RimM [Eubacteriales bacterium]